MMEYHGRRLRLRLEGESHSPEMRVAIWGLPVGEPVDKETLLGLLARRRPGQSPLTTGRNEKDEPEFLSGARDGMLTGEPVVIRFANEDQRPEDYAAIRTIPRPGHADYPQYLQGGAIPSGGGLLLEQLGGGTGTAMEGGLLLGHVLLHGGFIVGGGFPLHKGDGPGGTGGQAVAQTIAVVIAQQAGLALHHADGALVAGSGADAAAGAFFLIYLDNSTDHRTTSLR